MMRCTLCGGIVSGALVVLAVACANGDADLLDVKVEATVPNDDDGGGRIPSPGPSSGSLPVDDGEGGAPTVDAGDGGGGHVGSGPCDGKIVINEVLPEGSGGSEFVELYNPASCAVSLGGWKIQYRSKDDNSGPDVVVFASQDSIAPNAFFVLGNDKFAGSKDKSFAGSGGLGNAGGQIGLVNDNGALVDALGYGSAKGKYTEKSAAPLPSAGSSVGRKSDGLDTDNNAADFKTLASPTPGASN